MAVFAQGRAPLKAQIGEKVRIFAGESYASSGSNDLTSLLIDPETASTAIEVFNSRKSQRFLDWQYSSAGSKTVTLTVSNGVDTDGVLTFDIEVVTASAENLFSNDNDLVEIENDIMGYLPSDRSDFRYAHRAAQRHILDSLNNRRVYGDDGERLTATQIIDIKEVQDWSKYWALYLIFKDNKKTEGDTFIDTGKMYKEMADQAAEKSGLRLDFDRDGTQESHENRDMRSGVLRRR